MEMRTPISRSSDRTSIVCSALSMAALSVISSSRESGSRPVALSVDWTVDARSRWLSCSAERLTATRGRRPREDPVRAQDLDEPGPLAGIGVVLGHAPADALAPGGVAEDAGEGVVAVEDGPVGRQGAENPGLVALEQRPVALLRLAQRFLGALAGADVTREEDGADGLPVAVDERGERHADLDRLPLPGAEDHLGVAHHLSPRQVEAHGGAHPGLGQPLDGSV